jgi:hypothetical protein
MNIQDVYILLSIYIFNVDNLCARDYVLGTPEMRGSTSAMAEKKKGNGKSDASTDSSKLVRVDYENYLLAEKIMRKLGQKSITGIVALGIRRLAELEGVK